MRTAIVTTGLIVLGALSDPQSPAKEIVEIKVHGYYFAAPATVPMTIAVEPGEKNRVLVVEVDSDNYFRSSGVELDGEKEKRLHALEFRSLPAGEYTLRAEVRSKTGVLGTATGGLVVTGMTPEQ
jgi:hypothetical protein